MVADTDGEKVGGTVVNIEGDHGNVPGPGWKHSLSHLSAKPCVTWLRALCHFILITPAGESQVSVPQCTDDRLKPRAGQPAQRPQSQESAKWVSCASL